MDLAYEQFLDILSSFRTIDRSKDAGDKRRARRIGYRAKTHITFCGSTPYEHQKDRIPVLLRDFSPRGVSLLINTPMERGQSFVLHFKQNDGDEIEMLCTAVHCQPGGKDRYIVGAEFSFQIKPEPAQHEQQGELERIRQSILD